MKSIEESLDFLAKGRMAVAETSWTRPSTTTQYTANDLMHSSLILSAVSPLEFVLPDWTRGKSGLLYRLVQYKSGNTTANSTFAMQTYRLPPSVPNAVDNTPYVHYPWADRGKWIGNISFGAFTAGAAGAGCYGQSSLILLPFEALPNNILYAYQYAAANYSPDSQEQFYLKLFILFP